RQTVLRLGGTRIRNRAHQQCDVGDVRLAVEVQITQRRWSRLKLPERRLGNENRALGGPVFIFPRLDRYKSRNCRQFPSHRIEVVLRAALDDYDTVHANVLRSDDVLRVKSGVME